MNNIQNLPVDDIAAEILPALRAILSSNIALIRNNKLINDFCKDEQHFTSIVNQKSITIDCPLFINNTQDAIQAIAEFQVNLEIYRKINNRLPQTIMLKDIGLVAAARDYRSACLTLDLFENALCGKKNINNATTFNTSDLMNVVENKIVVITGGAQGFGGGIAEQMIVLNANVVIADLNETAGRQITDRLNDAERKNIAVFIKTDVSNPQSVQNLIIETVKQFGGLDVFISNAGILHAGGLDEMTPETFELMTKINYTGYFLCVKYAAETLKLQAKYSSDCYFSDIIQINSKSGLKGSNKNFAYSGGKFGGIGLTQSFALELMQYRIKVNSVCPGNFFDGPLWSDPEKGLFVQYLNAGKVPGAKTIADVKAFYENQVPAKRGCTVNDVMKAILYIIDQKYETGQAIPVTGGQNMLN